MSVFSRHGGIFRNSKFLKTLLYYFLWNTLLFSQELKSPHCFQTASAEPPDEKSTHLEKSQKAKLRTYKNSKNKRRHKPRGFSGAKFRPAKKNVEMSGAKAISPKEDKQPHGFVCIEYSKKIKKTPEDTRLKEDLQSSFLKFIEGRYFYTGKKHKTLNQLSERYLDYSDAYNSKHFCNITAKLNSLKGNNTELLDKTIELPITKNQPESSQPLEPATSTSYKRPKGIYMTAYTAGSLSGKYLIDKFHKAGGDTIIVDMKNVEGNVFFPLKAQLGKKIGAPVLKVIENFHKVINYAHDYGMKVVVRLTCFADRKLAQQSPTHALKDKDNRPIVLNQKLHWVDPANVETVKYLLELTDEILTHYGVDEIQLDYVRYPDYAGLLKEEQNQASREDVITAFVQSMQEVTKHHKRSLSLAVFGIAAWENDKDIAVLGQRLPRLARYCQGIHSMLYSSHFSRGFAGMEKPADEPGRIVHLALKELKNRLPEIKKINISPWLQAFKYELTHYDENYILENIKSASAHGEGYFFWNASNNYEILMKAMEKIKKMEKK